MEKVKVTISYQRRATFTIKADCKTEHGTSIVNAQRVVRDVPFSELEETFGAVIVAAPGYSEFEILE